MMRDVRLVISHSSMKVAYRLFYAKYDLKLFVLFYIMECVTEELIAPTIFLQNMIFR